MNLYHDIAKRAAQLAEHPLIQYFDNKGRGSKKPFEFAPKMAFFVLGFKDMLAVTAYANPKTPLEFDLNNHCQEDADHWQWYLQDLQTLAALNLIAEPAVSTEAVLTDIWSECTFNVRKVTYDLIKWLDEEPGAEQRHMIIECLEAAFGVFISHLTPMTKHWQVYQKLKYFGEHHQLDEAQHAMGAWVDGIKEGASQLSSSDERAMLVKVEQIFDGFEVMFDCWYAAVNITQKAEAKAQSFAETPDRV